MNSPEFLRTSLSMEIMTRLTTSPKDLYGKTPTPPEVKTSNATSSRNLSSSWIVE